MDYSKFLENEKIRGKESELKKLADSKDAEKIKAMVDGEKLQKALDEGDTETLQSTIAAVLNTREGASIMAQLEQLFK